MPPSILVRTNCRTSRAAFFEDKKGIYINVSSFPASVYPEGNICRSCEH